MYISVKGNGPPMVLIHGWGMAGSIWTEISKSLSKKFELHILDLPGMGKSGLIEPYSIDEIVDQIYLNTPNNSIILGWSMGGQISIKLAVKYSYFIKNLILISTTPCFIQKKGWNCAVDDENFANFARQLTKNRKKTMLNFLALQLLGSEGSHKIINNLKRNFIDNENENYNGLIPALNLLRSTDLRTLIPKVKIPTLIISGCKDKLTPSEASLWMQKRIKNSKIENIETASHIPFISNKNDVLNLISNFLETGNGR
jgi:pimeloyl-[acyl-carrier protein] methyl ester esterase